MFEGRRRQEAVYIRDWIPTIEKTPAVGDVEVDGKDSIRVSLLEALEPLFQMPGCLRILGSQPFDALTNLR